MSSRTTNAREYHIVVLGSGGVGKSCLTMTPGSTGHARDHGHGWNRAVQYARPIVQQTSVPISIADSSLFIAAMRDMYMRMGQGFLLVFSITSLSSLKELIELREQIIQTKNDPQFPIVLVGNKSDLEDDRKVSRTKAFHLSQTWGNIPYYETSARRDANVTEVFVDVCRQIIRKDLVNNADRHPRTTRERFGRARKHRRDDNSDSSHSDHRPRCTIS